MSPRFKDAFSLSSLKKDATHKKCAIAVFFDHSAATVQVVTPNMTIDDELFRY